MDFVASHEERAREPQFHYDAELDIYYKVAPSTTTEATSPTSTSIPASSTSISNATPASTKSQSQSQSQSVQHGCKRTSRGEKSSCGRLANTNGAPAVRNGVSVFPRRPSQEQTCKRRPEVAIEKCSVPSHTSTHNVTRVDVDTVEVTAAGLEEDPVMLAIVKYYDGMIHLHINFCYLPFSFTHEFITWTPATCN